MCQEQGGAARGSPNTDSLGQDIWVTEHRPSLCPSTRPVRTRATPEKMRFTRIRASSDTVPALAPEGFVEGLHFARGTERSRREMRNPCRRRPDQRQVTYAVLSTPDTEADKRVRNGGCVRIDRWVGV